MKHVFIMNPESGKVRSRRKIVTAIEQAACQLGADYEIYFTKGQGDGGAYAHALCEKYCKGFERAGADANRSGDLDRASETARLRIYGCGGDGTINEMVNGCFGYEDVEIGAIPMGTGNDYIRNYGKATDFKDIRRQMRGRSVSSDLIHLPGAARANAA